MLLSNRYEMTGSSVKGVAIKTATNEAYEMMKHGPGGPEDYEAVDAPQKGSNVGMYEVPLSPPPQSPLPDPPPSGSDQGKEEEEVYEAIPGEQ